ncbi:uncharacterized protein BYT42DRAFT_86084 [Radiomyces spectabilis]|uniref:uncharacterized protein n=1 Tax=Radiomyces spectabilis TaxID=64574 RepID=UPI002220AEDA|nr:uncharacterized protein BYT42DRAFT_86084 [Radiomyces spectabilis]KAI8370372.1 hypothetical protein BYT42DRAFT_86084 [Radiomyces spectabilis]
MDSLNFDRRLRLSNKKAPASPTAPRWGPKTDLRTPPDDSDVAFSEESFPSLTSSPDDKKKRSVWNDASTMKKKLFSPLLSPDGSTDPFAGMNSCVNYQQEIERLKALVPKVEGKKRSGTRNRPTGSDQPPSNSVKLPRSATPSGTNVKPVSTVPAVTTPPPPPTSSSSSTGLPTSQSTTAPPSSTTFTTPHQRPSTSGVTSPRTSSRSMSPTTSSGHSTPDENSAPNNGTTEPVITEEEKLRFLEFVRNWTGGWNGWDSNLRSFDSVRKGGSLWAEQTPWSSASDPQRHSLQESLRKRENPLVITMPKRSMFDMTRSEPCTPMTESSDTYWQSPLDDLQMNQSSRRPLSLNPTDSFHDFYRDDPLRRDPMLQSLPSPRRDLNHHVAAVGTIGDRHFHHRRNNSEHDLTRRKAASGNGASFGVSVM